MNSLTYKNLNDKKISVISENKVLGHIHKIKDGFQYRPRGARKKFWGDVFSSFKEIAKSLEGE